MPKENIRLVIRPAIAMAFAALIGYACYSFLYMFASEGIISGRYDAFTIAAERAIQLDRFGRTFAVRYNGRQINLLQVFDDDPSKITCDSHIDHYTSDMKSKRGVYVIIPAGKTSPVYIIYTGRPPDFSKTLGDDDAGLYFAPQRKYYSGEKANGMDDPDSQSNYNAYIKNHTFSWHSYECPSFTYTVVTEE